VQAFRVAVHPGVLSLLAGPGGSRLEAIEAAARRRFYLVPAAGIGHVHFDHFEVLAQGKRETLQPAGPVQEGAEIELKLVEVGLYDAASGVGKLDGWDVVVVSAAKLIGKKVKVRLGRVLEGVAYGSLVDAAPTPTPITFEAEAEKPTRAPARKKLEQGEPRPGKARATEPEGEAEPEAVAPSEPEPEGEAEPATEAASPGDEIAAGDEPSPKRKRTRRGTRGGRGRKKPAAPAAGAEEVAADGARPAPRIHVPPAERAAPPEPSSSDDGAAPVADVAESDTASSEEGVDGQSKRKRTRRGSRGGRRRKKPATNGASAGDEEAVVTAVEPAEPPEYVPMSEWIEDFDSGTRPR